MGIAAAVHGSVATPEWESSEAVTRIPRSIFKKFGIIKAVDPVAVLKCYSWHTEPCLKGSISL